MSSQSFNCGPIFDHLRLNNFHFSESWVIECVNYFKTTVPGISLEALKNEVEQQWLLLNLRDVKVPSLPPDLKSKEVTILNGNFAVQVETMIDSSRSCYSQFQKLRNADTDHIETEEDIKSKRCLTFLISDGVQEIQAMEYQIIKKIKTNDPKLLPGFKMVILGPVECRKGMILLKNENVRLCGGEVAELVTTNSLKNILIRRLELDEADYQEVTAGPGEKNGVPHAFPDETASNNFDDGFVESLLSQDDDVFFNVPLQPVNHDRQHSETLSISQNISEDISDQSEDILSHTNSATITSTLPQEDVQMQGRMPYNSELHSSKTINFTSKNLSDAADDGDIFIEDYDELQSNLQISALKSQKPVQTKLSSFFKSTEIDLNSSHRTVVCDKQPTLVSHKPFMYLKHIMSLKLSRPTVFTIKGIILTLKKKLTIEKEEYKLKANITDGSSSVDCNFCSEILETFLGYSPCEMTVMIKAKQANSAISERVKEAFSKAQEKLISLNCLMDIKFFTNDTSPLILSLKEVEKTPEVWLISELQFSAEVNSLF